MDTWVIIFFFYKQRIHKKLNNQIIYFKKFVIKKINKYK